MSEEIKNNQSEPKLQEQISYDKPEIDNSSQSNGAKIGFVALLVFLIVLIATLSIFGRGGNKKGEDSIRKELENIKTEVKSKIFKAPKDNPLPSDENDQQTSDFSNEPDWLKEKRKQKAIEESLPNPLNNQSLRSEFKPKVFKSSASAFVQTNKTEKNDINNNERNITWEEQRKIIEDEKEFERDVFVAKSAKKLKFNPSLLLQKGTYIGCSLDTRLVSQIAGQISCTVSENIYSKDGVTLLIEKGSKVFGSFRSGQMNDGMNRIFVAWSEIRTPNNINIPVQSRASDKLGGSGINGYVDHQWLKRFGASILLSVIDDAFNYVANGKRNNSYDYSENTRDSTQQMANTALEEFIKIKPVLYKNQGDIVGVYVNRDIDFSKVYTLQVGKKK